jgi:hypothetical protein
MKTRTILPIVIPSVIFIIAVGLKYNDFELALFLFLFIVGFFIFNLNCIYLYKKIEAYFMTKQWVMEKKAYLYLIISTLLTFCVFLFVLPQSMRLMGMILSACLLIVLLLYDLFKKALHRL